MKKKRILVLTDNMPWGHRSIAKAIYGFLKKKEKSENILVDYAEVKISLSIMNDIYTFMYRYLPQSNKISRKMMENEMIRDMFLETTDSNLPILMPVVKKYKPDLIISSYFFNSHSLARWRMKEKKYFKLWTVVADPWTNVLVSFVKNVDYNLVYDEVAYNQAIGYGIPDHKIQITGWWTRQEMYKKMSNGQRAKIKEKMGIENGEPVVFIGGGSLGTSSITRLLPVLLLIKQKCTIIFNTGTDKLAFKMIEEYKKIFDRINKKGNVKILNFGWIENMAEVLTVCDIVFGKAGPNFLFDVVANHKPFVAITHIGGQEDGNIDLILKKKLGWVKEGLGEAENFLLEYLKKPDKYNNMYVKSIVKEADNNKKTMEKIWRMIKKCPTKS